MSGPPARSARWGLNLYAALGLVYLFVPMSWIVCSRSTSRWAASTSCGRSSRSTTGATRSASRGLTDAFVESLKIAAISTAIATVLGSMIAIALARYRFRGSEGSTSSSSCR